MNKKTEDRNLTAAIDALNGYVAAHASDNSYDVMQISGVCTAVAWFLKGTQNDFDLGRGMAAEALKDLPKYKTSVEQARRILARQIKP